MLKNEFKKVEEIKEGLEWKLVQILFVITTSLFPLWVSCTVLFKRGGFSEMTSAEQMSSLAAVATFSLLAWGGRLSYGMFPVIHAKRIRNAIHYSCFVPVALWWIVFLNLIVPRYDFTMGQFVVTFLWAFITPAGAWIGLHWGIEAAARKEVAVADLSASQS